MSPALRALLIATGVSVGGFALYVAAPETSPDEVRLAALGDGCVARAAEAEFSVRPEGQAWLADAGIAALQHVRMQFPVGICAGSSSVILPELPLSRMRLMRLTDVDTASCVARPGVCLLWGEARPFRLVPHACAWRPTDAGVCGWVNPDGGAPIDFGTRNTMQAGSWQGAACQRKTCGILTNEVEP